MNSIRQTQALNKRELEAAVPPSASWHADYRDTAYIYIGGFPFDLSEGDLLTIFSQYGNPTHLNLIRDRNTGKSKGFAFLKYEDQRSCDLAVDNLGGAEVLGRVLKVDHTRYKKMEGEYEDTWRVERWEGELDENTNRKRVSDTNETDDSGRRKRRKGPMLKEERELEELMRVKEGEEEDPMRQYLIEEKKGEVEKALAKIEKNDKHRHRLHRDSKHKDRNGEGEHRSHRRKDGDTKERRHRHHRRDEQARHHRGRRKHEDDDERESPLPGRRQISDDERSRSRSRDRRRRHRERSVSRDGRTSEPDRASRRRDVEYRETSCTRPKQWEVERYHR